MINEEQVKFYAGSVLKDGFCVIPSLFPVETLENWHATFLPLLEAHIEREGHLLNRGSNRYYVTLPFVKPFADPAIFENPTILAVVEKLVGKDGVMCQLATDTPLRGSQYQEIHRDTPPLFPEIGQETPPYQLAVNFPLVDVTPENGPMEVTRGTHMLAKEDGMQRIEQGEIPIEPVLMRRGDVMVRDVRGLHRGTPNNTDVPRPMVVIGYSRRWLFRPEVSIRIPRQTYDSLSEQARHWLRFNPIVDEVKETGQETYQSFAY